MITEEQARAIHSMSQVHLVSLPLGPDMSWPDAQDGIAIKELYFAEPGIVMGQHAHEKGHTHLVGSGEERVWVEGVELGDFTAGQTYWIEPWKRHMIMSLKANTRGFCITNVAESDNPVVARSVRPS